MTRVQALMLSSAGVVAMGLAAYGEGALSAPPHRAHAAATTTVRLKEYRFLPATVTVTRGTIITAMNVGKLPHNLTIEKGPNGKKKTAKLAGTPTFMPRQTRSLKVNLKPGAYVLVCTFDGHRQLGMIGRITVR